MIPNKAPFAFVLAPLVAACFLAACGGGGGDSSAGSSAGSTVTPGTTTTPPTTNTGSVSSRFAAATSARYFLSGVGSQVSGVLNSTVQDTTGAVTKLNDYVLSGTTSVMEIAGSASYAQGRWAAGTVTRPSGSDTLTGTSNAAYHYLAFNNVPVYPTAGSATCDSGAFTAPSYVGGTPGTGSNLGTATGSAALTFGSTGVTVTGALSNVAGGSTGSINFNTLVGSTSGSSITGSYFSGGPGAQIAVGADGTAGYTVATGYSVTLANGARYQGVASFRCK